jgi:hypothetical protein
MNDDDIRNKDLKDKESNIDQTDRTIMDTPLRYLYCRFLRRALHVHVY